MTTAPALSARRPKHKQTCSRPDLECSHVMGARRIRCPECLRYVTLARGEQSPYWDMAPPTYAPPVVVAPPPPPAHGYACRPHYAPVTWRGTGCRQCDAERRESKRERRDAKRTTTTTTTTQGEKR